MTETKKDTKEKAGKIVAEAKKIDDGRSEFRKQALINVMYLYGRQHFKMKQRQDSVSDIDQRIIWEIEALRKASDVRRVSNYILPLFRSVWSRLLRLKANVHVNPLTSTERDRDAASVAQEAAEHFWETCNANDTWLSQEYVGMQAIISKIIPLMLTLGDSYLVPFFNPKATSRVYDKSKGDIIKSSVGEVEAMLFSPLNVFRDRFNRSIITRRHISPEQVMDEFGVKVKPGRIDEDLVEMQIRRLLEGSETEDQDDEGVYVYTKYSLPVGDKEGKIVVCTDNEVLDETDLSDCYDGKIPVFRFSYQDLGFARNSQGAIEQVIDLQQDYNETLTRITSYKKLLCGKLMNPRGSKVSVRWDDETGQVVNYQQGFKPTYEPGAVIPSYIINELMRIRRDMEDAMNSHDTSMGRPGGVKSGVAIDNLSENDFSMIAPELVDLEKKLADFTKCALGIMEKKYTESRLLAISGDDMAYEVKSFIGKDLNGEKRIKVNMGSNLPQSPEKRQQYIDHMVEIGYITPQRGKELSALGDIEGAFKSLDVIGAKNDILNIIEDKGVEVLAEPFEDHTIRLKVINDFRKGNRYAKLDEDMRAKVDDLAKQHQEYLLQEQEASKRLRVPMPGPAMPQPNQRTGAM